MYRLSVMANKKNPKNTNQKQNKKKREMNSSDISFKSCSRGREGHVANVKIYNKVHW